jgi:hypothetical protein
MHEARRVPRLLLPTLVALVLAVTAAGAVDATSPRTRPGPPPVVVKVDRGGFDWADAAAGAAATFAIVLVAIGARLTLRAARQPTSAIETRGARR